MLLLALIEALFNSHRGINRISIIEASSQALWYESLSEYSAPMGEKFGNPKKRNPHAEGIYYETIRFRDRLFKVLLKSAYRGAKMRSPWKRGGRYTAVRFP